MLCEELARIVCCDPLDVDTTAAFHLLGVDSILGAEFVATINRVYGLREWPVTLWPSNRPPSPWPTTVE